MRLPCRAWLAATVTFAGFAVASFDAGWAGLTSCSCFGPLKVSPWVAFAVDVLALTGLVVRRPDLRLAWSAVRAPFTRPHLLKIVAMCAAVVSALVLLAAVAWVGYGSTEEAIARLHGDSVTVRPFVVHAGDGQPGQIIPASVEVKNWTDKPVHIVGGSLDCTCSVVDELPVEVPPRESRWVTIKLKLPPVSASLDRPATIFIIGDRVEAAHFRVTGRSMEASNGLGVLKPD